MKKRICLILGGSVENMHDRVMKTLECNVRIPGVIILAGLPGEVKWMCERCEKNFLNPIHGTYSWDTLTNFTRDLFPYLDQHLDERFEIFVPTGSRHGDRAKKIWQLFAKKYHKTSILQIVPSGELDGVYESQVIQYFYSFGKLGILTLCLIARILRRKEWRKRES